MPDTADVAIADETESIAAPPVVVRYRISSRQTWNTAAAWLIVLAVSITSLAGGWWVRRQTFDLFDAIHFENDIRRGSMWGLICNGPEGFRNQYDKMDLEADHWEQWSEWLDYAPLRLLVMTRWADWIRTTYPTAVAESPPSLVYRNVIPFEDRGSGRVDHLEASYQFHRPLLLFNATMDAIGAAAAFTLTRLWVRRSTQRSLGAISDRLSPFCGLWQGLAAGLVLWLNPTILIDAYAWPTWDAWIVPFFLLTALAASLEWWFVAGLTLGIGAMFKGQQLAVAPGLAAWALVVGGPRAALAMASGTLAAIGAIVSPWTLTFILPDVLTTLRQTQASRAFFNWPPDLFAVTRSVDWPAISWVIGLGASLLIAAIVRWRISVKPVPVSGLGEASMQAERPRTQIKFALVAGAALLVFLAAAWPWCLSRNRENWEWGVGVAVVAALLSIWPWSGNLWRVCGVAGAALIAAPFLFSGSTAWWTCAFHFGTAQFP